MDRSARPTTGGCHRTRHPHARTPVPSPRAPGGPNLRSPQGQELRHPSSRPERTRDGTARSQAGPPAAKQEDAGTGGCGAPRGSPLTGSGEIARPHGAGPGARAQTARCSLGTQQPRLPPKASILSSPRKVWTLKAPNSQRSREGKMRRGASMC